MRKVLFIGDVHGRFDWKELVLDALVNFREVVFLGDYVDSYDISPAEIMYNLQEIVAQKKKSGDRITLLIGNHDYAYIHDRNGISGFQFQEWQKYKKFFKDNRELFQLAWGYRNPTTQKYTLATHAGLTTGFYDKYIKPKIENPESDLFKKSLAEGEGLELHETINLMWDDEDVWTVGRMRGGWGDPGFIWADYRELLEDPYQGINQVFGHTASGTVTVDDFGGDIIAKVDGYGNKQLAHLTMNI